MSLYSRIKKNIVESQFKKSIFRVGIPNSDRKRVLVMLGNVFLHLHPTKVRTSGVKLRFTWCAGGLSFFLLRPIKAAAQTDKLNLKIFPVLRVPAYW